MLKFKKIQVSQVNQASLIYNSLILVETPRKFIVTKPLRYEITNRIGARATSVQTFEVCVLRILHYACSSCRFWSVNASSGQ